MLDGGSKPVCESTQPGRGVVVIDVSEVSDIERRPRTQAFPDNDRPIPAGVTKSKFIEDVWVWIRHICDDKVGVHDPRQYVCGDGPRCRDDIGSHDLKVRRSLEQCFANLVVVSRAEFCLGDGDVAVRLVSDGHHYKHGFRHG